MLFTIAHLIEKNSSHFIQVSTKKALSIIAYRLSLIISFEELMSEETLEQHETYKHQLEKEKEEKAPILKTINKYFELLDEMKSLEVFLECSYY